MEEDLKITHRTKQIPGTIMNKKVYGGFYKGCLSNPYHPWNLLKHPQPPPSLGIEDTSQHLSAAYLINKLTKEETNMIYIDTSKPVVETEVRVYGIPVKDLTEEITTEILHTIKDKIKEVNKEIEDFKDLELGDIVPLNDKKRELYDNFKQVMEIFKEQFSKDTAES